MCPFGVFGVQLNRMKSKVAQQAREDLLGTMRSLTPEQRLEAFLRHSRLVTKLYRAGRQLRTEPGRSRP